MGKTAFSDKGSRQLSDRHREFVDQYLIDLDGKKAAIRAGYKPSAAAAMAVRLLNRKDVKAALGKESKQHHEENYLTADNIILQLAYITTRDIREFVDEHGEMIPLNKLHDRAAACVDGFDQEITIYTDENGTTKTVKNKVKLVSKATAIDMAMRYRGLFAPTETKNENVNTIQFDFNKLFSPPDLANDPVEEAMKALEDKGTKTVVIEASKVTETPIKKPTKKTKNAS